MIGDRPIGSLLRSSPDGPGKRDGYDLLVISQCIFLLPDFDNTDVDNLTVGHRQLSAICLLPCKLTEGNSYFFLWTVYFLKMMVSCIPSEKTSVGRLTSEREPA